MPPPARTTTCGRPGLAGGDGALERIVVARVDALALVQPSSAKRSAIPPRPAVGGADVVDDDGDQPVEAESRRPARSPRGWSPRRARRRPRTHEDARRAPALRAQRERTADGDRQPVPRASRWRSRRPRISAALGVVAERRVEAGERRQVVHRDEALGRQHRVVRRRPVALREQQAVALWIVDRRGRHVEHWVVQHPVEVERGGGARIVLGIALQEREQPGQVVVAQRGRRGRRRGHDAKLQSQVHLKSRDEHQEHLKSGGTMLSPRSDADDGTGRAAQRR